MLRIATRKSPLALKQSEIVKALIQKNHPETTVEFVPIVTEGDKWLDAPLAKVGGKGLFINALQQAVVDGKADLAVHSMKDMPAQCQSGLVIGAVLPRENPYDAFVASDVASFADLPQGARVGTSSLRRQAQLSLLRPDLQFENVRGNVGTRLKKLDDGHVDALILAAAGLIRLDLQARITHCFEASQMLPAVAQGVIGLQWRTNDSSTTEILKGFNDKNTADRVAAERGMNQVLNGGCQVPIAGFATLEQDMLQLKGLVASPDGRRVITAQASGHREQAQKIGHQVGESLFEQGAKAIIDACYGRDT